MKLPSKRTLKKISGYMISAMIYIAADILFYGQPMSWHLLGKTLVFITVIILLSEL